MATTTLAAALGVLRDAVSTHGASLSGAMRLEIGQLALELLASLAGGLEGTDDPRVVLQALDLAEAQYRGALRAQLQAVAAAEATGAHALATAEYDRVKAGTTQWAARPEYAAGRTNHRNTAALVAAWAGINEFEAAARVADAHRLVARRTAAGAAAAPRYARLATLFLDPGRDPRPARDAARRIEKLEPDQRPDHQADPVAGALPGPLATGPDGVPLEDHAVRLLAGHDRLTASKRVSELCTAYRAAQREERGPGEYFRRLRTIMGVDVYQFAVQGAHAEVLRSLVAQWDNPATKAGKAARTPAPAADPGTTGAQAQRSDAPPAQDSTDEPVASWLTSSDPPPDWAIDPRTGQVAGQDATPGAAGPSGRKPAPGSGTVQPMRKPGESRASSAPIPGAATGPAAGGGDVPVELRRLTAFMQLLTQRTTATGKSTQVLPTINVYLHLSQLLELAHSHGLCDAQGVTTHGVKLGAGQLRRMLCEANIIPYVLGGQGEILDMGRARRTFTRAQRRALLARDRGCIGPGCSYPPERCEAHHCDQGGWAGGCPTNVEYGSMLCPNEHDDYHAGKFRIVLINGLPHVVYAQYIDPSQTPRRNTYWFSDGEPGAGDPPPPLPGLPAANTAKGQAPPPGKAPPGGTAPTDRTAQPGGKEPPSGKCRRAGAGPATQGPPGQSKPPGGQVPGQSGPLPGEDSG